MNKMLFLSALLCLSILLPAQVSFKAKPKKQPGTTPLSFSARSIQGKTSLKSASFSRYPTLPQLTKAPLNSNGNIQTKIMQGSLPVYIEKQTGNLKSTGAFLPEDKVARFFQSVDHLTRLDAATTSFRIDKNETDRLGIQHIKATQYFKGIEVYGAQSVLHLSTENERFTGRIRHIQPDFDTAPGISRGEAIRVVQSDIQNHTLLRQLSEQEQKLLRYKEPSIKPLIYKNQDQSDHLAWEVEIRPNFIERWIYFVDAKTGTILDFFNATCSDGPVTAQAYDRNNRLRTLNTYLDNGTYILADFSQPMYNQAKNEGIIVTYDANHTSSNNLNFSIIQSANNEWNNATAVSAHANTATTFQYFYTTFGRNSINGDGGNILSFINVTDDNGESMANAYWNGEAAFYGNGGSLFKPLAGAQDVISHELGHGVVQNTANLEYRGQSGAINETYADIFGSMVDREDWLVGEDIVIPSQFPAGSMRNMADPHNGLAFQDWDAGWQPKHLSEIYLGEGDNGGVHINNSIGNHAFYLYASKISKEKAEQVFYRALDHYLTKYAQFIDFRIAVVQAARDLYGNNSTEMTEAGKAFDAVGVYGEEPVEKEQEYEANTGEDFLMSYDTDENTNTTLYRSSVNGEDFLPITATDMKGKVSITDDGSALVFAGTDDYMKFILLDGDQIEENDLSSDAFWDNVAVSKDGNRVAGISTEVDTAIYVFDLVSGNAIKFMLYNPTTSHDNMNAGGVLYADVIEFDHTGEYLIYDAHNVLTSTTYEDIYYWDIGFIHVWDNQANDFGDGRIEKLFGSLPRGVSIGNPVFSKNSPYIIAFDYFEEEEENYAILGANILTGDIDVIFNNTTLGYPSFSKNDDKIAFSGFNTWGNEIIGVVKLAENKISASGEDAIVLVNEAKWPVYYSTGTRQLGLAPVANFTADYKSGSAPFEVQFIDLSLNNPVNWLWDLNGGDPTYSDEQNPLITYHTPGTYRVSLTVSNNFGDNTIRKEAYVSVYPTAVDAPKKANLAVYPNPVDAVVTIPCNGNFSARITDLNGKELMRQNNRQHWDLTGLKPGIYFMEVQSEEDLLRQRFVKK